MINRNGHVCLVCGNSPSKRMIRARLLESGADVFRCDRCALVFFCSRVESGQMDPEERAYWQGEGVEEIYLSAEVENAFAAMWRRRLNEIAQVSPKGRLLDVGCGTGLFLFEARKQNWQVEGLDIAKESAELAKKKYGLDRIHVGRLEDHPLEAASYDVVTLWDVIEHMPRPMENVRALNRLLRPGGVLAMQTPDEGGLFKLLARLPYRLFGERGGGLLHFVYYIPHYVSFCRKSMTALLERGGFEVIRFGSDESPQVYSEAMNDRQFKGSFRERFVKLLLPLVYRMARLMGRPNKLVVYARKVRELPAD